MGEETALERLFQSMDKDGDGAVTKEVANMVQTAVKIGHKKRAFNQIFITAKFLENHNSKIIGLRLQRKQAGAEQCQAQMKLGLTN